MGVGSKRDGEREGGEERRGERREKEKSLNCEVEPEVGNGGGRESGQAVGAPMGGVDRLQKRRSQPPLHQG